jgi:S-formylglutathione hydrolase
MIGKQSHYALERSKMMASEVQLQRSLAGVLLLLCISLAVPAVLQPLPAFGAASTEGQLIKDVVHCSSLEGNLLGDSADRNVMVYLPPSYDEYPNARYPVVYLLHGSGDVPAKFTGADDPYYQNFNIQMAMDELVNLGGVQEMIFVMPDASNRYGGSWYRSSPTIGDWDTCIAQEIVDYIDGQYRTIVHSDSRGIAGYSMGGYGAMHLALTYPDRFGAVVSFSGHYDSDYSWKSRLEAAALEAPKDWSDYSQVSFLARSGFAVAAGISPNPDNPPFFVDLPFNVVNGEVKPVPEIWDLYAEADITHGHFGRYLDKADWLNGIMLVHGSTDTEVAPVSQARALDEKMEDLGIEHVYWEHNANVSGDSHVFIGRYPERWLRFFSEVLKP